MKSVNKKALACLLALVMGFESMTGISVMAQTDRAADAVGAAGDSFVSAVAMQPEEKYDVTLAAEGNAYYKFTPEESGSYTFHVTGGRVSLYLHDEDLEYLDENWGNDFDLSYDMEGGKTYYINLSEEDGEETSCKISVSRELLSLSYESWYTVNYGEEETLEVAAASGRGPVSYQWYEQKWSDESEDYEYKIISGATQSSYTVTADTEDSKRYQCAVTDGTETRTAEIRLEVITITSSVSYPYSVEKGETVTMQVQAESLLGKELTYQWYHEEMVEDEYGDETSEYVLIPGATDSTFQVTAENESDAYKCEISDGTRSESVYCRIHIRTHINVTGQTKQYVRLGESVTFQAKAKSSDGRALTYVWGKRNEGEYSYTTIAGAGRADYTVRAAEGTAPYYQCQISDGSTSVYMHFEFQIIPPTEKEIDRIVLGEGWPTIFAYEEIKKNDTFTNFTYNKPLTVKYKDGTEKTVNYGYCCWLDLPSGNINAGDSVKAYISYMGKTVSYDASIINISETGTMLSPGEERADQAGAGDAGRKYYSVSIPANEHYIIQISDLSGEAKETIYSGLMETSFTNGCYELNNIGVSRQIYFSVESAGTQPVTYSVKADTAQNSSRPLSDSDVMQEFGYYRASVEVNGLYEVIHTGHEKDEPAAVLYNEELDEVCTLYNQSTKYYLKAGEIYYIKNQLCGAKFQLAEEKSLPAGTKAGAEDQMTWNLTDNGILTIDGEGDMPQGEYRGRTPWVRTSWNYIESDSQKIQQIKIGNGITSISGYAFQYSGIEEIELPDSVKTVNRCAFYRCESLQEIILPNSLKEIGSWAFAGCSALSSIRFSGENHLEYIAQGVFADTAWANNQGDFVILDGVLLDYQGGAQEIVVPDAIREIAPKGLTNVNAQKIVLPKQLVKIWEYGVSGCKNLKEINIPGNVSDIAYHAFSECTALESAVINEGTENIGHHAFAGCSALKTLTIKEGLKQIEDHAFVNDRNLTEATIPKSVVSIGEKAFGYYSSFYTGNAVVKNNPLLTMRCYPDSKAHQYAVENALSVTLLDENGQEIKKPSQNTGDNGNAPVKTGELHTVKDYAYEIISANTVAFAGLAKKDSKSVKIPDKVTIEGKEFKVTEVKDQAFQKTDIKSVTMPSGIQSIGTKAFYSCKKLKKITIPASVSEIGSQAFGNCKKLKNITVKTTMLTKKSIGKKAFKGISEKAAIKVPKQKLKAYQKLFKSKGAGTKVKFKK